MLLLAVATVDPLTLSHADANEEPELSQPTPQIGRPRDPRIFKRVYGVVKDQQGRPVAGAKVYFRELGQMGQTHLSNNDKSHNLAETLSDADGRFSFSEVNIPEKLLARSRFQNPAKRFYDLIAVSPQQGIAWKHLQLPLDNIELTFTPQGSVRGRLLDKEQQPIANCQYPRDSTARHEAPAWTKGESEPHCPCESFRIFGPQMVQSATLSHNK